MTDVRIHVSGVKPATPLPTLAEYNDKCPHCGCTETESGYGLAAGVFGVYLNCADCHRFVAATEDEE